MKGICIFKRLLFINILCLLWLPNFCDIKHNGAETQSVPSSKITSDDTSRVDNVPSKQEKEIHQQQPDDVNFIDVLPNVKYVNKLETHAVIKNKENIESLHSQSLEDNKKETVKDIKSSRAGDIDQKESSSDYKDVKIIETLTSKTPDKLEETVPEEKIDSVVSDIGASVNHASVEEHSKSPEIEKPSVDSVTVEHEKISKDEPAPVLVKPVKVSEDSLHHQPHYDGMPSFDEWKKMMLAEQEKGGKRVASLTAPGKKISSQKRRRNYSSFECGAKIVASNSEAEGTSRILNELVDEYMLNPCKAKIWFVIELCETVQANQIDLANFELFSSSPKDFIVYSSDTFPTRDWVPLGTFTAAEQRVLQSFELKQEGFGKFIKIELLSRYGTEHYCPLSVVRIFGTSMVDEYEEMETLSRSRHTDIHEDDLDRLDIVIEDKKPTNLFGSATDAVMNIVKKAAQALGQHQVLEDGTLNETVKDQQNASEIKLCSVVDQSQNKCQTALAKLNDTATSLKKFPFSSSSMHQSLFRLLHRCDQCVSPHISYYSSAQPHCRFFQAALGPVIFQTLCDWFKEHPLVIPQETSSHRNKLPVPNIDSSISPTKSPPPQVMRVSIENEIPWKKLISTEGDIPLGPVQNSIMLNKSQLSVDKLSNISSNDFQIHSSMQPTSVYQNVLTTIYNESKSDFSDLKPSVLVSSGPISKEISVSKDSVIMQTEVSISSDKASEATIVPHIDLSPPPFTPGVPGDLEVEQVTEILPDSLPTIEDVTESLAATEMPVDLKPSEDKSSDLRAEFQEKIESASLSGIATVGQKESVFMRMSNRIKALEINMSLSSQYLQELSQRYRRQMEEMQRAFNRTIGTLNDTAKKAAERDLRQQDILNTLQLQVANLSQTVELLLNERSSVFRQMIETHVCLMVIEAIIMITIMSLCVRRISSSSGFAISTAKEKTVLSPRLSKRRSSADSCTSPIARKLKKRSASEEALNAGEELLIIEPLPILIDPMLKVKKKNRKRNKAIQRSNSNPTVPQRKTSTSQFATKRASHSDGYIPRNERTRLELHEEYNTCENCIDYTCTAVKTLDKERRLNGAPFQNLTNGSIISPTDSLSLNKPSRGKGRFSFKKFLKLQKRDSI